MVKEAGHLGHLLLTRGLSELAVHVLRAANDSHSPGVSYALGDLTGSL